MNLANLRITDGPKRIRGRQIVQEQRVPSASEVADALRAEGWIVVKEPDYEAAKGQIVKLVVLAEDADPLADDWEFWSRFIVDSALAESSKGVE